MTEPPRHELEARYANAVRASIASGDLEGAARKLRSVRFLSDFLRTLGGASVFTLIEQLDDVVARGGTSNFADLDATLALLRRHAHQIEMGGHLAFLQLGATFEDGALAAAAATNFANGRAGDAWLLRISAAVPPAANRQTYAWGDDPVLALSLSPGGDYVAAADAGGHVVICASDGTGRPQLRATGDARSTAVCALDEDYLVTGAADGTVRGFDRADLTERFCARWHATPIVALASVARGERAASASRDGLVVVCGATDGKEVLRFHVGHGPIGAMVADDAALVLAVGDQVEVWDPSTGSLMHSLAPGVGALRTVARIPRSGDLLVAGDAGVARVEVATGAARWRNTGLKAVDAGRVAVHPEGTRCFVARRRSVEALSLDDGTLIGAALTDTSFVDCVVFSRDGRTLFATHGEGGALKIWSLDATASTADGDAHDRAVLALAIDRASGRVYTGGLDNVLRVWDVVTGALLPGEKTQRSGIVAVQVDGVRERVVTVAQDSSVTVYDAGASNTFWLDQFGDPCATLTADGAHFVTGGGYIVDDAVGSKPSNAGPICVWSLPEGKLRAWLDGHEKEVTALAAHPDPVLVLSASLDRTLRVWDVHDSRCVRVHPVDRMVSAMAVHPDGDRVLLGDSMVAVWSLQEGRCTGTIAEPGAFVVCLAWHPDGEHALAISRDRTVRVWHVPTATMVARWDADAPVRIGGFGARDRIVLGDDDGKVTFLALHWRDAEP